MLFRGNSLEINVSEWEILRDWKSNHKERNMVIITKWSTEYLQVIDWEQKQTADTQTWEEKLQVCTGSGNGFLKFFNMPMGNDGEDVDDYSNNDDATTQFKLRSSSTDVSYLSNIQ